MFPHFREHQQLFQALVIKGLYCVLRLLLILLSGKYVAAIPNPSRDISSLYCVLHLLLILLCGKYVAAIPNPSPDISSRCIPIITDSTADEDAFRQIECEISKCPKVSKIIYEKTDVISSIKWTPVFEGINKTVYYPIKMGDEYTLEGRSDYTSFHTKHLLYIRPLVLKDKGSWRCVVYDDQNNTIPSMPIDIIIHVAPKDGMLEIGPLNISVVSGQITHLKCVASGIYPEPDFEWLVNGMHFGPGVVDNTLRPDELLTVVNTVALEFNYSGVHLVECLIKTKTRNPWLYKNFTINIKEPAKILEPNEDKYIATNANFTFHLLCTGLGFRPVISWLKDDIPIDNTAYTIQQNCNTERCSGSIKPKKAYRQLGCQQFTTYTGVYKCIISLKPPYNSEEVSGNINVYTPQHLCDDMDHRLVIGLTIFNVTFVVVVIAFAVAVCTWLFRRKQWNSQNNSGTDIGISLRPESQQLLDINESDNNATKYKVDFHPVPDNTQ